MQAGNVSSMRHYNKPWSGWGAVASITLHLAVVSPLIFQLAEALPKPPEENIKVEIVPPEPPPLPEKPATQPAVNKAQPAPPPPPPPKAFQSAPAKVDRQVTTPQLPSADENPLRSAGSANGGDEPAADPEGPPTTGKPPLESKQDPARLSLSEMSTGTEPRKPDEPTAKNPARNAEKTDRAPATARSGQKSSNQVRSKDPFSPDALIDPRVLQAMGKLSARERIVQLCKIEALDRIRRQRPDSDLLAYDPSMGRVSIRGLDASGVAFRTRSNWYDVKFNCRVDAGATKVVSFSYVIGSAVPKSKWASRGLILD
jgi:hypothetical protein